MAECHETCLLVKQLQNERIHIRAGVVRLRDEQLDINAKANEVEDFTKGISSTWMAFAYTHVLNLLDGKESGS